MSINRRQYDRYLLPAGYTPVSVRRGDCDEYELHGHAYNISEGGVCFELDEPLEPGAQVGLMITLPGDAASDTRRAAFALANVIWVGDVDEPGPVQHAAAFTLFAREGDREALIGTVRARRYTMAA
ncbi:MAG: PilZ domain-containing protein [Phycisphaerales bacterium]|nr:PilZ domain-containing protein [Phycisphaerales bacterium]